MAIHHQNYAQYDGPLNASGAWRAFAQLTFRLALSFKRTWVTLFLLWIPTLFTIVAIFIEYGLREKLPGTQEMLVGEGDISVSGVTFVLGLQFVSASLLMLISGCQAISDDLRYQTFQLYFCRPLERWEYLLGKFLGTAALCSLVTLVPGVLIAGLRTAYFANTIFFQEIFKQSVIALAISAGITALVSCIVLGLSSLTRQTSYAVLGFVALLFVPLVISAIAQLTGSPLDIAQLWSLPGNVSLASHILLAETPPDVPLALPFAILGGVAALGVFAMRWRVHKLEGIA